MSRSQRFVGMVLGICASCVVMLGVTADVAFAQAPVFVDVSNFTGAGDGFGPFGGLIQASDGNFYGEMVTGGAFGFGTVFRMDANGTLTTLHAFDGSDGYYPTASLIQASDGNFYGTTEYGGASGYGNVFKMDASGTLTTLHAFAGSDGALPVAALIQARDGNFYGTTSGDCRVGGLATGTVFKMDASGTLTTLHSFAFDGSDGVGPEGALIQTSDGNFYGTTSGDCPGLVSGTVFKMDASGTLTTLHTFNSSDSALPSPRLIQASDGSFYGTTASGGTAGFGVFFRLGADNTPIGSSVPVSPARGFPLLTVIL